MIPVRVPADARPVLASDRRMDLAEDHPLFGELCPVCDEHLGARTAVLVFVGIAPGHRKPSGYTVGGAVAVHSDCAGV